MLVRSPALRRASHCRYRCFEPIGTGIISPVVVWFILLSSYSIARERFTASTYVGGHAVTCVDVRTAVATWPRAVLDLYRSQMTAEQLRMARRCLGKRARQ